MKIAVISATGFVGAAVVAEALSRGHPVGAIARHPEKLADAPGLTKIAGDILDPGRVAALVKGYDYVVSAYNPGWTNPDIYNEYKRGTEAILAGVKQAGLPLLIVGGAGSLEVAPGVQLVDTEGFPDAYKPVALAARDTLKQLQAVDDLDWTFYSPAAEIGPGPQRGGFRTQATNFLVGDDGHSRISYPDYADAFVSEIETPQYVRQIATVAY